MIRKTKKIYKTASIIACLAVSTHMTSLYADENSGNNQESVKITMINNAPLLKFNEKLTPILIAREHKPADKIDYLQKMNAAGISIVWIPVALTGENEKIHEAYDANIGKILKELPGNAKVLLQFLTTQKDSTEWARNNPDELIVWPPAMQKGNRNSTASEKWRTMQRDALRNLAEHVMTSPYSDRIIGAVICGGGGEWLDYWDYSEPAQTAFRKWLSKKYNGDIEALRKSWNDIKITFDTAEFPKWSKLSKGDCGTFYDPSKSRNIIDYFSYHHEYQTEVIADFANAVKSVWKNKMLVGAWYGSLPQGPGWNSPEAGPQRKRHGALEKLLDNPDLDFFIVPYNYSERHCGSSFLSNIAADSILLHGKIPLHEEDTRTFLTQKHPLYNISETVGDNFGQSKSPEESVSVLKRNFAGISTKPGSGISWFSLSKGLWFNDKTIIDNFSELAKIADKVIGRDSKTSEIAVIVSQESLRYQKLNQSHKAFMSKNFLNGITKIGAPFDVYIDSDLRASNFPFEQYKFYIFLNTFYLSAEEKEIIEKKIKTNGNTVLWFGCPGFVTDENLSEKSVSDLVGMKINHIDPKYEFGADIVVNDYSNPMTMALPKNMRYGTENYSHEYILSPLFWCDDPDATVLGEMIATPSVIFTYRKPGLCVKKFQAWTSVWSAVPNMPSSLFRNIAARAGVHIYDDGDDQVFASRMLLGIHSAYSGERTIRLPGKYNVYDPFKNKYIAKEVQEFRVFITGKNTELWLLENVAK